jgi:hypothetical protein
MHLSRACLGKSLFFTGIETQKRPPLLILRLNTSLSIAEKALGKAVLATGTPTVVVVVNGGAVSFDTLVGPEGGGPRAAAVVEAGYACDNMRALAELMFGDSSKWCGKRPFLSHFHIIKTNDILPRQARDKHEQALKKEGVSLSAGASLPTRSTLRQAPTATFHATVSRLNVLAAASHLVVCFRNARSVAPDYLTRRVTCLAA